MTDWPGLPDRTHLPDPMRLGDILETILNPPHTAGFLMPKENP